MTAGDSGRRPQIQPEDRVLPPDCDWNDVDARAHVDPVCLQTQTRFVDTRLDDANLLGLQASHPRFDYAQMRRVDLGGDALWHRAGKRLTCDANASGAGSRAHTLYRLNSVGLSHRRPLGQYGIRRATIYRWGLPGGRRHERSRCTRLNLCS